LVDAAEDILAYRQLPLQHQRSCCANPLERLNIDIKTTREGRRQFSDPQLLIRLVGAILLEPGRRMGRAQRRCFSAELMKPLTAPTLPATAQEICC
jgi:hypothetical protein